jgi:signal transduction histidine kinase
MRRNVTILMLATTSAVVIGLLIPLAILIRQIATDRAIAAADQDARTIAVAAAVVTDNAQLDRLVEDTNQRSSRPLTVVLPTGRVLGPPPPATTAYTKARGGLASRGHYRGGEEVFVPVTTTDGRIVVRSFVPHRLLVSGVVTAWLALAALGLAMIAMTAVVADRLARWLVRPISQLVVITEQVSGGDLEARVPVTGPAETARLAIAFNGLAKRIGELISSEREVVADLSHRLRTPITALRLDAEALPATVDASRLNEHVTTLERTVNHIITTARRPLRSTGNESADVVTIVRERLQFWSVLAEDQNRPTLARLPGRPVLVRARAEELAAAVDAVLENVFAHSEDGAGFQVLVEERDGGGAVVVVTDEGPGLASDQLDERGRSTRGSTGLGLDIARRTAEASGGRLHLANLAGGGAAITVELGPAGAPVPI